MSSGTGGGGTAGAAGGGAPSEEELRAAYEAELSRITSTDMILQTVVSLLNIGARRLAPGPEDEGEATRGRDLEQARDAIDAVRALLEILERRIPGELRSLRDALSQLQMAYAREAQAPAAPAGSPGGAAGPAQPEPAQGEGQGQHAPGPAESSGRLWVPDR